MTQPHPQRGADFGGLAGLERTRANDFLQGDDVGVDRGQDRGDPLGARAAVEPPAAMNVVGDDSQRPRVRGFLLRHQLRFSVPVGMARLKSELELTCPCCNALLVVDVNLGRIIEHREPPSADRPELSEAQRILEEQAARREALFAQSRAG